MARRTFPDPDRADSYFELLDDPVRPAPIDRVALAESELRRLGLDDARVRADGDSATVLLPGSALAPSSGSVLEGSVLEGSVVPGSVLESEVVRAVRSAGFGAATVVRVGGTVRVPRSGDDGSDDHDDDHDDDRDDDHDDDRDDDHDDDRRDNKWQPVVLDDPEA